MFAARHGVSLPKFDYRVRQLQPGRRRPRGEAPAFAAVEVVPPPPADGVIEIVLARGDRLIVRAEADVALVRTALKALCGTC